MDCMYAHLRTRLPAHMRTSADAPTRVDTGEGNRDVGGREGDADSGGTGGGEGTGGVTTEWPNLWPGFLHGHVYRHVHACLMRCMAKVLVVYRELPNPCKGDVCRHAYIYARLTKGAGCTP